MVKFHSQRISKKWYIDWVISINGDSSQELKSLTIDNYNKMLYVTGINYGQNGIPIKLSNGYNATLMEGNFLLQINPVNGDINHMTSLNSTYFSPSAMALSRNINNTNLYVGGTTGNCPNAYNFYYNNCDYQSGLLYTVSLPNAHKIMEYPPLVDDDNNNTNNNNNNNYTASNSTTSNITSTQDSPPTSSSNKLIQIVIIIAVILTLLLLACEVKIRICV